MILPQRMRRRGGGEPPTSRRVAGQGTATVSSEKSNDSRATRRFARGAPPAQRRPTRASHPGGIPAPHRRPHPGADLAPQISVGSALAGSATSRAPCRPGRAGTGTARVRRSQPVGVAVAAAHPLDHELGDLAEEGGRTVGESQEQVHLFTVGGPPASPLCAGCAALTTSAGAGAGARGARASATSAHRGARYPRRFARGAPPAQRRLAREAHVAGTRHGRRTRTVSGPGGSREERRPAPCGPRHGCGAACRPGRSGRAAEHRRGAPGRAVSRSRAPESRRR